MVYVDNAVILAAGKAERFVPLSYEIPKGLLNVRGEILIERQIRQLQEAGIGGIFVVTGYKAEHFAYLREKYRVHLIDNPEYATRNNHSSIWAARDVLKNTYICSSDNYFSINPFTKEAEYAYYAAVHADGVTGEWCLQTDADDVITGVTIGGENAWYMLGHVLWDETFSRRFLDILEQVYDCPDTKNKLWEAIYMEHIEELRLHIQRYDSDAICEFDTLDELRVFDSSYMIEAHSGILQWMCGTLSCTPGEIMNIRPLNKGMTNHTCVFTYHKEQYLLRIPGEGTDEMIDRRKEAEVYRVIDGYDFCDRPVAFDENKGYRITRFLSGVRTCGPYRQDDVRRCMRRLREFHQKELKVGHTFDLWEQILFYESLRGDGPSQYKDYDLTKEHVLSLKSYTDQHISKWCLAHIDAVPDNFLFYAGTDGTEQLQLSDWEYAGMQDPHVDIAMFVVYSGYNRRRTDDLIDIYFEGGARMRSVSRSTVISLPAGFCGLTGASTKRCLASVSENMSRCSMNMQKPIMGLPRRKWTYEASHHRSRHNSRPVCVYSGTVCFFLWQTRSTPQTH